MGVDVNYTGRQVDKRLPWNPSVLVVSGALLVSLAAISTLHAQIPMDLPVSIAANSAELDDRQGTGVYQGDVVVTRGNMTLWADRITLYAPERRPERLVAEGRPVRAEMPDPNELPRTATAQRMEYHFATQMLTLTGEARVHTNTEDARGERITYDLTRDVIRAESSPGQRVQITIQPRPE